MEPESARCAVPARRDDDPDVYDDCDFDFDEELDVAPPPPDRPVRRALERLLLALALLAADCALVPLLGPRSTVAALIAFAVAMLVLLPLCIVLWFDLARAACAASTSSRFLHHARLVLGIPQAVFGVLALIYVLGVGAFLLYMAFLQRSTGHVLHLWTTAIGAPILAGAWQLLAGSLRRGRLRSRSDDAGP